MTTTTSAFHEEIKRATGSGQSEATAIVEHLTATMEEDWFLEMEPKEQLSLLDASLTEWIEWAQGFKDAIFRTSPEAFHAQGSDQ